MTRFNLQFGGKTEELLKKVSGRKKSIILNSIVSDVIKSGKIKDYLSTFYSTVEIEKILDFTQNENLIQKKTTTKKVDSIKKESDDQDHENSDFKIEL